LAGGGEGDAQVELGRVVGSIRHVAGGEVEGLLSGPVGQRGAVEGAPGGVAVVGTGGDLEVVLAAGLLFSVVVVEGDPAAQAVWGGDLREFDDGGGAGAGVEEDGGLDPHVGLERTWAQALAGAADGGSAAAQPGGREVALGRGGVAVAKCYENYDKGEGEGEEREGEQAAGERAQASVRAAAAEQGEEGEQGAEAEQGGEPVRDGRYYVI
jgi:hypothetical protein